MSSAHVMQTALSLPALINWNQCNYGCFPHYSNLCLISQPHNGANTFQTTWNRRSQRFDHRKKSILKTKIWIWFSHFTPYNENWWRSCLTDKEKNKFKLILFLLWTQWDVTQMLGFLDFLHWHHTHYIVFVCRLSSPVEDFTDLKWTLD